DVVNKLHNAIVQAMTTPSVRDRLEGLGAVIVSEDRATPQYLAQFVKSAIEKWARPIKASGGSVELSLQLRPPREPERKAQAASGHRCPGRQFLVAFDLALRQRLAHCLLHLALGTHPKRLEKLSDAAVENILIHDRVSSVGWVEALARPNVASIQA